MNLDLFSESPRSDPREMGSGYKVVNLDTM